MKLPKISIVIATYNSERTIDQCLTSILNQDYPRNLLEIIIADGGSSDNTINIAKKYKCTIIHLLKKNQDAEYNKANGLKHAESDFILCLDHDNILPHRHWLVKMLGPFEENSDIVAVEPLRYHYDRALSLLDRYFALFGVNDPIPYYLGKADRMDYIHQKYNLLGDAVDKGQYYSVLFDTSHPSRIPTLGANGFLIRKSIFLLSNHLPGNYYHIDINVDLVKKGYNHYAFIKDDIIHLTNSKFFNFLKRRMSFVSEYYFKKQSRRRYSVYTKEDFPKLCVFILYTITIIKPLIDSVRGFIKIHDRAWFVHPFMCWAVLMTYFVSFSKTYIKKTYERFLGK